MSQQALVLVCALFVEHLSQFCDYGSYPIRRYETLEGTLSKRKPELSDEENLSRMNTFMPGFAYRTEVNMSEHIPDSCPNKAKASLLHVLLVHCIVAVCTCERSLLVGDFRCKCRCIVAVLRVIGS